MMSRPTLKDVASRAGVSVMSASLAIRDPEGSGRVSVRTRDRVLAAAREIGYRPDARARALRLRKTNVIGFYAGYGFADVRMPFFAEVVGGLQQGCEATGKNLLLHSVSPSRGPDQIYEELIDGTVDGLVVAMPADDPVITRLVSDHLPVVAVADAIPGIPSVVVDDIQGAKMLAEHIAGLGHRSALFASAKTLPFSAKRRQQAFIEVAISLGLGLDVRAIGDDSTLPELIERARQAGTTAIVAWNDHDARRLLKACRQAGIRVPSEMAITGFDGCPVPFEDPFPLTTIRAPWAEVAERAAVLLDRLAQEGACDMFTTLPVQFVKGATT